jgi:hypothetical protein
LAEATTTPPVEPPAAEPPKFHGTTYPDQEKFEEGLRNIATATGKGYSDDKALIGTDGHFQSVEYAVGAYKAMQRIKTEQDQQKAIATDPPADPPTGAPPADPPPTGADDTGMKIPEPPPEPSEDFSAAKIVEDSGLVNDDVVNQYLEHGKLTDTQYNALRASAANLGMPGITKSMINDFMAGGAARAASAQQSQESIQASAAQLVNGDDSTDPAKLQNLLVNAPSFIPADELDDVKARLLNPKQYKGALRDLLVFQSQANQSDGSNPLLSGGTAPPTTGAVSDIKEYGKLLGRAGLGDKQAQAELIRHAKAVEAGAPVPM